MTVMNGMERIYSLGGKGSDDDLDQWCGVS